jgi:hypothetical protein
MDEVEKLFTSARQGRVGQCGRMGV